MILTVLMSLFSIFLDLLAILGISTSNKDLEIIILRQQVRILQRKVKAPGQISPILTKSSKVTPVYYLPKRRLIRSKTLN